MKRSEDRILTSHTGALHRPKELQQLALDHWRGQADESADEQALKQAVIDVVRRQAKLKIDIVNDGEFTKSTWFTYVAERMAGIEFVEGGIPELVLSTSGDRSVFPDFHSDAGKLPCQEEEGR